MPGTILLEWFPTQTATDTKIHSIICVAPLRYRRVCRALRLFVVSLTIVILFQNCGYLLVLTVYTF